MMCAMAVAVFAQDRTMEYEYAVSVTLQHNDTTRKSRERTVTEYVWASSHEDAIELAKAAYVWKYPDETVISCGFPRATGKSRPR